MDITGVADFITGDITITIIIITTTGTWEKAA
jgi:hypothetical protein